MPFDGSFDDIYKFGIKGAAHEIGAYAERVDEQIFNDGILERIFNQISRADVVVADMTGRNPNVFYEVGYAHALGKIVLLLTQRSDDIPFDLKHRQHTVYGGSIEALKRDLVPKLSWAVVEAKRRDRGDLPMQFTVRLGGVTLISASAAPEPAKIAGKIARRVFPLSLQLRNDSSEPLPAMTHIYLFTTKDSVIVPTEAPADSQLFRAFIKQHEELDVWHRPRIESFVADVADCSDDLCRQYRLPITFPVVPPGAVEDVRLYLQASKAEPEQIVSARLRLRLHAAPNYAEYPFALSVVLARESPISDISTRQ